MRPSLDIDVMAFFSQKVFDRFDGYAVNGQSALLQEVKEKLEPAFPQTRKRGDGQVVQIAFNSIMVELVPVLDAGYGQLLMPDTHGGGSWKTVDPRAQIALVENSDRENAGNLRPLCKMMKRWKHACEVDLKSFAIELMVVEFFRTYEYRKNDYFWYDWFVRDCLRFFRSKVNGWVTVPGTGEIVWLGNAWAAELDKAIAIAERACDLERDDFAILAGEEWQKIFGTRCPIHVL